MSATPEVVSSLTVIPSSFSTTLNQASRCAFWKAPPQDEMVMLCCARPGPGEAIATTAKAPAPATMDRTINALMGLPLHAMDATPSRHGKQRSQLALAQVKDIAGLPLDMAGKAGNLLGSSAVAPRLGSRLERTGTAP